MKNLSECEDKEELIKLLETYFNHSTSDEIYTMIKILTGSLRVGVSSQLLKESLSKIGVKSKSEIEEKWFGFKFPYTGFFEWLNGEAPKDFNTTDLFHSFMLSNPFDKRLINEVSIKDYICEYKWDGIRAQLILSKSGKVYSSGDDDIISWITITKEKLSVLDGELVVKEQ